MSGLETNLKSTRLRPKQRPPAKGRDRDRDRDRDSENWSRDPDQPQDLHHCYLSSMDSFFKNNILYS